MRIMHKIQKTKIIIEIAKINEIFSTLIAIHSGINVQSIQRRSKIEEYFDPAEGDEFMG